MRKIQSVEAVIIITVILLVAVPGIVSAQWIPDGIPVCSNPAFQGGARMVADGYGGAIIVWYDFRNGVGSDIFITRVNSAGYVIWSSDGIPICIASQRQWKHQIISHGSDGAIIAWEDRRNNPDYGDVYAQRVNIVGVPLWTTNGIPICTATAPFAEGFQGAPVMVSDGSGGAIIAWQDGRGHPLGGGDVYAQRANPLGEIQWTVDGIPICQALYVQGPTSIVSDGSGGAIIAWTDSRNGTDYDIYTQRVNSVGSVLWTPFDGVPICTSAHNQFNASMVPDGMGGAIIAWEDSSNAVDYDIYAQHVNSSGNVLWTTNGIPICSATNSQKSPDLASDGSGGAIITWEDPRGSALDIYAQRIDYSGNLLWTTNGIPICTSLDIQKTPSIIADGSNGAIITWLDRRNGGLEDIYAQRVNGSGNVIWTADGIAICTTLIQQLNPNIVSDGFVGGAIIAWDQASIYAQRIYCEVEPTSLDFGTVGEGESEDLTFTIENMGGGILSGTISETCSHFSIASGGGSYSLAYGESRLVTVRFEPMSAGTHMCMIETGNSQCADVSCVGIGLICPIGTIYVDTDATGTGDGTSWGNAFTELRDALWVVEICSGVMEIWVAEGTYTPTAGTLRSATFALKNGLALYGGFVGIETSRSERDWMANVTVLSGDIGVVDDSTDNSYHVIIGSGIDLTAVLDGFTITGGNADGSVAEVRWGGGMYVSNGSPTVANNIFIDNAAYSSGGGMFNTLNSSPLLTNIAFIGNSSQGGGGGITNASNSNPTLTNVIFDGNIATNAGGGMYNNSSDPILNNVVFIGNSAAVGSGGGINNISSSPILTNVTLSINTAHNDGGGMRNWVSCYPVVTNTIFWSNSAPSNPEIFNLSSAPAISYSLIQGSGGSGPGWDPSLGTDGGNNIDADPQFKLAYSSDPPLSLWSSSPAINAGSNAAVPVGVVIDLAGNPRIHDTIVDMGAYEHQGGTTTDVDDIPQVPDAFALYQNAPNPFNPATTIRFDLPRAEHVKLTVYNVKGELVSTIVDQHMTAGRKEVSWTANDNRGRAVTSGIYFYRFVAGDFVQTKKMALLK